MSPEAPWLRGFLVGEGDCHLLQPSFVAVPGAPWLQGLMVDEGGRHLPEPSLVIVPGAPWLQFLKGNVICDRLNAQEDEIELDGGASWLHEEFHAGEIGRIFAGEARILVDEGGVHLPKHAAQRYKYNIDIRVHTQ